MGVIVTLVLLLAVGMVIMGCYMQKRRKSYRTEILQFQDVVMERNNTKIGTEMSDTITDHNRHYQKTQFDVKARSQSSPAAHAPEGITTVGNGVYYSKLEEGAPKALRAPQPLPPQTLPPQTLLGEEEMDGAKTDLYDEIGGNSQPLDESQYSTIDNCVKEKDQAMLDLLENELMSSDSPDMKKRAYSLVVKKDPPQVPKKSPELYRDLRVQNGGADDEVGENSRRIWMKRRGIHCTSALKLMARQWKRSLAITA